MILRKYIEILVDFLKINSVKILGFMMFSTFIYFKFLRLRLPKNIPFSFSVIGFIILVELCLIYAFIVWTYIKPPKKSNEIIAIISKTLYQPLDVFDDSIKSLIKFNYPKIFLWLSRNCLCIFKTLIFDFWFYIIPRFIIIVIFISDIFYFSKLHYFYYVILPLGLILVLRRYFIYSLNKLKIELTTNLKIYVEDIITRYEHGIHPSEWPENYDPDDDDDDDIPPTMCLDVEIFINYSCKKIIAEKELPEIYSLFKTDSFYELYKLQNTKKDDFEKIKTEEYKIELNRIIDIALLHTYILNNQNENKVLKSFKLCIYSLYFICWMYILFVSIHTLNIYEFFRFINSLWEEIPDSFSDCTLLSLWIMSWKNTKRTKEQIKNKHKTDMTTNNENKTAI